MHPCTAAIAILPQVVSRVGKKPRPSERDQSTDRPKEQSAIYPNANSRSLAHAIRGCLIKQIPRHTSTKTSTNQLNNREFYIPKSTMKTKSSPLNMKSYLLIAIAALLALSSTVSAYRRSCSASYRINVISEGVTQVRDIRHFQFTASASSSAYIPNTLRERAYRKARNCLSSGVNSWTVPDQCTTSGISALPSNYYMGFIDVLSDVCRTRNLLTPNVPVTLSIHGYVWGDRGCGGHWTKKSRSWHLRNMYGYCSSSRQAYFGEPGVVGPDPDEGM